MYPENDFPEIETCQFFLDENGCILQCPENAVDRINCPIQNIIGYSLKDVLTAIHPYWSKHLQDPFEKCKTIFLPWEEDGFKMGGGAKLHILNCGDNYIATLEQALAPAEDLGEASLQDLPKGPMAQAQMFLRLRTAESRLSNYMSNFPGIFFSQRPDLSFSYIGPGLKDILGIEGNALQRSGNSFLQLLLESDRPTFSSDLEEESYKGKTFTLNYRLRHPETGKILYVMDVRTPKRSPAGLLLGYEGVILDITRQAIAENRLSQAAWKESLATITSGLIHDFSNIMAGIYSLSELYYSSLTEEHSWYRGMQQIMNNSREASKFVRRIIDLNREISGHANYFNLEHLINDQMDLIRIILPRQTHIELNLTGEEIPLYIDDVSFRQMLLNLAMNTRDAIERDGEFSISIKQTKVGEIIFPHNEKDSFKGLKDGVVIQVSDNGCGIPKEFQEKIFDPFFTTKEAHKGSGFGLYNAKLFIHQYKGHISLESTPRQGTTFHIWLPLADFTENLEEEPTETPELKQRPRIALYAKLDTANFQLVSQIQEKEWEIITFSDAASAINFLDDKTFRPNLLLVLFTHHDTKAIDLIEKARRDYPKIKRVIQPLGCNPDELPQALKEASNCFLDCHMSTEKVIRKLSTILTC